MNERLARMAAAAKDLKSRLDDGSLMREVLQAHEEDIMQQQHIQLLEGKGSDGNDLRPYYTEDLQPTGYFKSVETASRYRAWKESLNYPYQVTWGNTDAPNLYINGRFYDELGVKFDSETMTIEPQTTYAATIVNKYGLSLFGLNPVHWETMMNEKGVRSDLQERVITILYE